ncbi:MAG: chorismate-binding protein [Gallionella sp.]|nr:chorismate-binding protein [Gallionella sp.]
MICRDRKIAAAAFAQVQNYLRAGDCYQVNLSQCCSAAASGDALHAYLALRRLSQALYSAFLDLPDEQILCASPERFLRVLTRRRVKIYGRRQGSWK